MFGGILLASNGKNMLLSTISISFLAAVMHGSNMILTAYVPQRLKRFGHVSTVSGIINSAVYVGAAVSTYGIASIKDEHGWNATIGMWIAIAAVGTVLSVVCSILWKKRVINTENG